MVEIVCVETSINDLMKKAEDKACKAVDVLVKDRPGNKGAEYLELLTASIAIRSLVDLAQDSTPMFADAWEKSKTIWESKEERR